MARIKQRIFRMKQFNIVHEQSANKVGVDGVLIGAWSDGPRFTARILDAGCGCGLISLMLAQRFPNAEITGIDIEPAALAEARLNAETSPWRNRINIIEKDFRRLAEECEESGDDDSSKFDMIVSNPPFFHSGGDSSSSARMLARHADTLSPESLIRMAPKILRKQGILSLIAPAEDIDYLLEEASSASMSVLKICYVKGNPNVPPKRVMLQLAPHSDGIIKEYLTIEYSPGNYTEDYKRLCSQFYIIF